MGSSVQANCPCGYEASSLIGGGMRTFQTQCSFPYLCRACAKLVTCNALSRSPKCPDCKSRNVIPYNDPLLCAAEGGENVCGWSPKGPDGPCYSLSNGQYYCPSCHQHTLVFSRGMLMWD